MTSQMMQPEDRVPRLQKAVGSKYTIGSLVGRGGMAEVFSATNNATGGPCAIKVLKDKCAVDDDAVRRFRNEASVQSKLNHKNLIAVFDSGQGEGLYYFCMTLVEGEDLAKRMERGRMGVREVLDIGIQIAEALEYAHDQGVFHRDLKPQNVRLQGRDHVLVMDFGIAKITAANLKDSSSSQTESTQMRGGTGPWMAPEQWKGWKPDGRSDLYALGVILYELLTGENPFRGADAEETERRHLRHVPPPVSIYNPAADSTLSSIVDRLLAKEPGERYQNAGTLVDALKPVRSRLDMGDTPMPQADAPDLGVLLFGIPHVTESATASSNSWTPNKRHVLSLIDGYRTVEEVLMAAQPIARIETERIFLELRQSNLWIDIPLST